MGRREFKEIQDDVKEVGGGNLVDLVEQVEELYHKSEH
jgi:predicted HAD superfamily phosphohydrolase